MMADKQTFLTVTQVPIGSIQPADTNARKDFGDIGALAVSIADVGILQPLVLQGNAPPFTLIAGERRYRAARLAGLDMVPAIIHPVNDRQRMILSVIENVQRKNLNPIEEAEAYDDLRTLMTQRQVAQIVGKHEVDVSTTLRFLALPESVKDMVRSGKLSRDHALEILRVPEERREALAREIVENRVPAARLREIRKSAKSSHEGHPRSTQGMSDKAALMRTLTQAQQAIDALYAAGSRGSAVDLRPKRDTAVELLDWAKGMVDPLHAESWDEQSKKASA